MTPESLRNWRIQHKLSRSAAARQLGCSRNSIAKWEDGKNAIPLYIELACVAISNRWRLT